MNTLATFEDSTKLKTELLEGETILWKGRPEEFPLMTEKTKSGVIKKWLIAIIGAVVFIGGYAIMASSSAAAGGVNPTVIAVIALVFAYVAYMPFMDRSKIIKKCKYYITDKRVLVAIGDKDVFALDRNGLKLIYVPNENGCVNILFGTYVDLPESKYLVSAFTPGKVEGSDEVTGILFYNLKDDSDVKALLG